MALLQSKAKIAVKQIHHKTTST